MLKNICTKFHEIHQMIVWTNNVDQPTNNLLFVTVMLLPLTCLWFFYKSVLPTGWNTLILKYIQQSWNIIIGHTDLWIRLILSSLNVPSLMECHYNILPRTLQHIWERSNIIPENHQHAFNVTLETVLKHQCFIYISEWIIVDASKRRV